MAKTTLENKMQLSGHCIGNHLLFHAFKAAPEANSILKEYFAVK